MSKTYEARDADTAVEFANLLVGSRAIGTDAGGNFEAYPVSPEIRAHLRAALGNACPSYFTVDYEGGHCAVSLDSPELATYLISVSRHLDGTAAGAPAGPYGVVDIVAAAAFADMLTGDRTICVDHDNNAYTEPRSPEVRAHLLAVLGAACPRGFPVYTHPVSGEPEFLRTSPELASYLRSVAQYLDDWAG